MFNVLFGALILSIVFNLSVFALAYKYKSDKLTDITYSLSFILLAIFSLFQADKTNYYSLIIFFMVLIWAIRLGSFLLYRVIKVGKDNRFDTVRDDFHRFFKFWLAQALTVWLLMIPVILAITNYNNYDLVSYKGDIIWNIGVFIWAAGLIIESIADIQKYNFRNKYKSNSKWINTGLWQHSRHPNYFGEILVWLGLYLSCVIVLDTTQRIISIISPIFITILLIYISGIPILENSADKKWGKSKEYLAFKKRTNLLLPLPFKKLN